jgi:hypothetical protein
MVSILNGDKLVALIIALMNLLAALIGLLQEALNHFNWFG